MALSKLDVIEQYLDNNGDLLAGGFIFTYAATTDTLLATAADALGTPNANPLELDSSGRGSLWFTQGLAYKVVIKDADGVTLKTEDGIAVPDTSAVTGSEYFDSVLTYPGGPPGADEWLTGERFAHAVDFLANWGGSFGKVPKTLPAASFVVTIKKNNSTVGTATCSTLGAWTFATSGAAAVSFAIGDEIDYWAPAVADTNIKDFGLTLTGTLA